MKNIKNFLLAALVLLGTTACDRMLDIEKHGNLGAAEDFYSTDGEVEQAAASMYLTWRGLYFSEMFTKNLLSDDVICGGGQRGDNGDMERVNEYSFGADNSNVQGLYSGYYSLIYKANLLIENVKGSTDVMRRDIAEARVARGYAHLMLGIYFGTAPVVDHLLTSDDCRMPNGTQKALFAQAIKDLDDAVSSGDLSQKTSVNDKSANNRITLGAAQAYLGKAYLFDGQMDKAAAVLDDLIGSGLYALVDIADYENLCHVACNNCCESILEFQKREDDEQKWTQMDMYQIMCGWRVHQGLLVPIAGSQAEAEVAQGCYGFGNPRAALYEAFKAAGEENSARRKATLRTYEEVKQYGIELGVGMVLYGNEGYYFWKDRPLLADCIDATMSYFQVSQYVNHRYMRYAEVLLMAAEANLTVNPTKASEYLNQVRTRAGLTATTATLEAIQTEKRLELCNEGVRFEDLVRWGIAANYLGEQGKTIPTYDGATVTYANQPQATYGFKTGKHEFLPIPMKELEINPNMKPNQGW